MKKETLALILGGGQGTRLFPLTWHRSKPAVPLGGKYRLIDITLSNCINSDISKVYVLTQFNSASLNRHIARTYRFSPFSDGFVDILAAEQTPTNKDWFQGTADAVRQVMVHIEDINPDNVLILSGDHLYRMDYREFLKHHDESNADVTVSVIPSDEAHASSFGLLKTNDESHIIEFREKPPKDQLDAMRVDTSLLGLTREDAERRPFLASMGVYVFKFDALRELLKDEKNADFGSEVIPAAINKYDVQAFLFDGYWEDIGTISSFYHANLDMASILPKFNLFDVDAPIYTRARFLPGSKLIDCQVRDSIISEGCILNRVWIDHSVIGIRSRIENYSRIEHSLIMGADYYQTLDELEMERRHGIPWMGIGENTIIRKALVDKNVRIGSNVRILNEAGRENSDSENGTYYIRDGIVIIPKNVTITDGTII
ncbi:MAG TPA: glucose-1-phosphate adenylyltransferase [Blastocatellia bacterium]|nr:glucose-1-phosphate adenylyltransferase [Blastocatellia bacterium]